MWKRIAIGVLVPWSVLMVILIVLQRTTNFVNHNFLLLATVITLTIIAANGLYFGLNGPVRKRKKRMYYY